MEPRLSALRLLEEGATCGPETLRHVAVQERHFDVICLGSDTFVHMGNAQDAFASGASARAFVGQRVGDDRAKYCVRRYAGPPPDRHTASSPRQAVEGPHVWREQARAEYSASCAVARSNFSVTQHMFVAPQDLPWGTIDRLAAGSLDEMCNFSRDQVTPDDLVVLLSQLGNDLLCLHRAGIMHRDIKEGNVVVHLDGERPRLRLIDLDGAVAVNAEPAPKHVIYGIRDSCSGQPPEFLFQNTFSPSPLDTLDISATERAERLLRADIYALGFLVCRKKFRVLPGFARGSRKAIMEAFEALRSGREPRPDSRVEPRQIEALRLTFANIRALPEPLAQLLLRMLAADPMERPDIATVLREVAASGIDPSPAGAIWFRDSNRFVSTPQEHGALVSAAVGWMQRERPEWLTAAPPSPAARRDNVALARRLLDAPTQAPEVGAAVGAAGKKKRTWGQWLGALATTSPSEASASRRQWAVAGVALGAAVAALRGGPTARGSSASSGAGGTPSGSAPGASGRPCAVRPRR